MGKETKQLTLTNSTYSPSLLSSILLSLYFDWLLKYSALSIFIFLPHFSHLLFLSVFLSLSPLSHTHTIFMHNICWITLMLSWMFFLFFYKFFSRAHAHIQYAYTQNTYSVFFFFSIILVFPIESIDCSVGFFRVLAASTTATLTEWSGSSYWICVRCWWWWHDGGNLK